MVIIKKVERTPLLFIDTNLINYHMKVNTLKELFLLFFHLFLKVV
jgi:hypothetical protein